MDAKYKYQLKRVKLQQKTKQKVKDESQGALDVVSNFLPILKNLDSDQIGDLIEWVQDRGYEPQVEGGLESILEGIPPSVISGFIKGLSKGGKKETFEEQR